MIGGFCHRFGFVPKPTIVDPCTQDPNAAGCSTLSPSTDSTNNAPVADNNPTPPVDNNQSTTQQPQTCPDGSAPASDKEVYFSRCSWKQDVICSSKSRQIRVDHPKEIFLRNYAIDLLKSYRSLVTLNQYTVRIDEFNFTYREKENIVTKQAIWH